MSEKTHRSKTAAQMRKRRLTGVPPSVQTNGPSTRVVPRQQPGTGTNTTNTTAPPDLSRRTDMWTDTDTDLENDTDSTAITATITSPSRPQSGDADRVQPTITTTTTRTIPARDGDVNRLRTFLGQRQGQPQSTDMEAALRQMQQAVDAHDAGGVSDQDLQQALATLRMIDVTGSATVPLTVATRPAPAFGLVLDGARVTELDQAQRNAVARLRVGKRQPDEAALGYILADGTFDGTTADLAKLLDQVEERVVRLWQKQPLDDTKASQIARLADEDEQGQKQLATLFGAPLDYVSGAQCRELRDFYTTKYPNFLNNLKAKKYIDKFVFASGEAASQGGGVFVSARKELHMAAMGAKAPEAFLRLMVHEAGHASFQRALVGDDLSKPMDNGDYAARLQQRAQLVTAYTQLQSPAPARGNVARGRGAAKFDPEVGRITNELAKVDAQLEQDNVTWDAMSDDAKDLYRAWCKLRENGGQYMIGVDLGRKPKKQGAAMDPAQRQTYQAGNFSEFCAESFMHLAMGDLDRQETTMQGRTDVPDEVKQAWTTTRRVLHKYGDPILN